MAGNRLTIKLTDDQQKQIRDATGKSVTELNLDLASTGQLAEKDLEQVAGGNLKQNGSMYFTHTGQRMDIASLQSDYFGHPSGGFLFLKDFVTACSQLPLILRSSGFGPGVVAFFSGLSCFVIVSPYGIVLTA